MDEILEGFTQESIEDLGAPKTGKSKKNSANEEYVDDFELPIQSLSAALEAILFVNGDSVSIDKLEEITGISKVEIEKAMSKLIDSYENNPWGGLLIRKVDDSYIMCTKPGMHKVIERMFTPKMRPPLSQASYETLAVIAYNQPVTRAQVETVRGVSSDSIISRLLDRGWIKEAGTLDAPGRPTLFATSEQFLLEFGISSIDELPSMELMSYKSIRDLESTLKDAVGGENPNQISIDTLMSTNSEDENEE